MDKQEVKVIEITGMKLDPNAYYLIAIERSAMSAVSMEDLAKKLDDDGISRFTILSTYGNPHEAIAMYQIPKEENNG